MPDPYRYFRIEAGEILEQLQSGLLELERGAPSAEIIPKLLRLAHTLKGAARVVKQKGIADESHALEDLLVPIRDAGAAVVPAIIEGSLRRVDAMRAQLQALSEPAVPSPEAAPAPQAQSGGEEGFWAAKASVEDLDVLMDGIAELNVQLG
ncbi:MAG: Hpt domain-containing protein, partial [Polyangiaceae bacterium]